MKTLVINAKEDLDIVDSPTPEPGDGQVRLKVAYVGICGSDLHYYYNGANGTFVVREPLTPGHEVSATVDLDPSGKYAVGTPVTVHPATFGPDIAGLEGDEYRHLRPGGSYLGSASTWPHTQGAMAQYLIVGADMVRPLPAGLDLKAAALAEPLSVVWHGLANTGTSLKGLDVLVCGCGPIGLLGVFAARTQGAACVTATDVLDGPLERAKALGADATLKVGVDEIPANRFDLVMECVGLPVSVSAAIAAAKPRGHVAQIGMLTGGDLPIALAGLVNKELTMTGAFRFNDEIDEAVKIIAAHPEVAQVVTHVLPYTDAVGAFAIAKDSQASGKVLVSFAD